ncbi:MAG: hypothetical protein CL484_01040 [Acidobacteria bacterium]|nr:hypothetical protein [Acidobacteriota bacterium]
MPPIQIGEPIYLRLLFVPACLGILWLWRLSYRFSDRKLLKDSRTSPRALLYPLGGELWFWFCILLAVISLVMALSRPTILATVSQNAGADFIILQDGSTSMRVSDTTPDRWQRSVSWIRVFAEMLSWQDQRVALALFAHRTAPQIRLTRDPNALFFFLDYLDREPPFRLEDDTSWDTNIEEAIYWGVQIVERDAELYGERLSTKVFIVISDGQSWSGEVNNALQLARSRNIRVYVIGVGTLSGGFIPQLPVGIYEQPEEPIRSTLDRQSLRAIAQVGGGEYYELEEDSAQDIALEILIDVQSRTQTTRRQETFVDLYWLFLAIAAGLICLSTLLLQESTQLWWQLAVASGLIALLVS